MEGAEKRDTDKASEKILRGKSTRAAMGGNDKSSIIYCSGGERTK